MGLYDAEASSKTVAKNAATILDEATLSKYGDLTEADIQKLVINDKWGSTISGRVRDEISGLIQRLIGRILELGQRYDSTLGSLEANAAASRAKVVGHLTAMGVEQ
jgi:type I restriction enzyme M protein